MKRFPNDAASSKVRTPQHTDGFDQQLVNRLGVVGVATQDDNEPVRQHAGKAPNAPPSQAKSLTGTSRRDAPSIRLGPTTVASPCALQWRSPGKSHDNPGPGI